MTSASPGGRFIASIAISICRSSSQAFACSILSCTLGLAVQQLFHFVGVGHLAELFGKLLVLGEQRPRVGDRFLDVAEDIFVRVEVRLLLQAGRR